MAENDELALSRLVERRDRAQNLLEPARKPDDQRVRVELAEQLAVLRDPVETENRENGRLSIRPGGLSQLGKERFATTEPGQRLDLEGLVCAGGTLMGSSIDIC